MTLSVPLIRNTGSFPDRCLLLSFRFIAYALDSGGDLIHASIGGTTTTARNLCLNALAIAINTTVDEGGPWYTSTKNLEVVCVDLRVARRACLNISGHVVVAAGTPIHLWLRGDQVQPQQKKKNGALAVPHFSVRAVTFVECPADVFSRLSRGRRVGGSRKGGLLAMGCRDWLMSRSGRGPLWWPETLCQLTFGDEFDEPIERFPLPASLRQLSFGKLFNQAIHGVV